jgi:hypothetical protein
MRAAYDQCLLIFPSISYLYYRGKREIFLGDDQRGMTEGMVVSFSSAKKRLLISQPPLFSRGDFG